MTCQICGRRPAVTVDADLGEVCARCWTEHARETVPVLDPATR